MGQQTVVDTIQRNINRNRSTRVIPDDAALSDYNRFAESETGISPWVIPGEEGAFYSVTGLEHSVTGNPNFDAGVHLRMNEKRFRKFETMKSDIPAARIVGDENAKIGLTCWGSPTGAVIEAMEIARDEGAPSKLITSIMINPQPEEEFQRFFNSCVKVIIPEMNHSGQYAQLMRSRYGIRPVEMHIPGVKPASPRKIANLIKEVHDELVTETPRLAVV